MPTLHITGSPAAVKACQLYAARLGQRLGGAADFAEADWTNQPGPRSKNRWVHVRTGRVAYSKDNPGKSKRGQGAAPPAEQPAEQATVPPAEAQPVEPKAVPSHVISLAQELGRMTKDDLTDEKMAELQTMLAGTGGRTGWSVADLKALKQRLGVSAYGNKSEMAQRIIAGAKKNAADRGAEAPSEGELAPAADGPASPETPPGKEGADSDELFNLPPMSSEALLGPIPIEAPPPMPAPKQSQGEKKKPKRPKGEKTLRDGSQLSDVGAPAAAVAKARKSIEEALRLAGPGSPVNIAALRQQLPQEMQGRDVFDRAIWELADEQKVFAERHDYPGSLDAHEREQLLQDDQGGHYIYITSRDASPEGLPAAETPPGQGGPSPDDLHGAFRNLDARGDNLVRLDTLARDLGTTPEQARRLGEQHGYYHAEAEGGLGGGKQHAGFLVKRDRAVRPTGNRPDRPSPASPATPPAEADSPAPERDRQWAASQQRERGQSPLPAGAAPEKDEAALQAALQHFRHAHGRPYVMKLAEAARKALAAGQSTDQFVARLGKNVRPEDARMARVLYRSMQQQGASFELLDALDRIADGEATFDALAPFLGDIHAITTD